MPINEYLQRWSSISHSLVAGKALEILIDNDSPKAYWLQEQRLLNSNGTPLGYLKPADGQSNSDVPMNLISFANELTWCKRKSLYFSEFNESLSIPKQLLANSISHPFTMLTR